MPSSLTGGRSCRRLPSTEEEAAFYSAALTAACDRPPETVLELGSGGGNNASHMKRHFRMTLVDPSPGMLAVSRVLNPDLEHVEGDMRTVRLGRQFDAVFIHDAVVYMTSEADVRRAIETAWAHCRPHGASFCAGSRARNIPSVDRSRRPRWTRKGAPLSRMDLGSRSDGQHVYGRLLIYASRRERLVSVEHDRHYEGLFSRHDWLTWLSEAGFEPRAIPSDKVAD